MLILLWVLISVWLGEFEELANGPGVLYYLQEVFVSQKELHMHVTILDDDYIITYKLMAMPYILVSNYNLVGKDNMLFTSTGGTETRLWMIESCINYNMHGIDPGLLHDWSY